ncbi:UNKNOWN [Stylonychia lemnae]|uniref:Uncharacterized protein n=1 Tax=Stylonychia lemnae TaxID=5949 RepID=A0A078B689_STYLE|nr:UNKNOWN [Stylonychia lemnae]|eukprot:CDW89741.1 UNKNOWN [Stylonychia lemnae]
MFGPPTLDDNNISNFDQSFAPVLHNSRNNLVNDSKQSHIAIGDNLQSVTTRSRSQVKMQKVDSQTNKQNLFGNFNQPKVNKRDKEQIEDGLADNSSISIEEAGSPLQKLQLATIDTANNDLMSTSNNQQNNQFLANEISNRGKTGQLSEFQEHLIVSGQKYVIQEENEEDLRIEIQKSENHRKFLVEEITPNRYNTGRFSVVEVVQDHQTNNEIQEDIQNFELNYIKDESIKIEQIQSQDIGHEFPANIFQQKQLLKQNTAINERIQQHQNLSFTQSQNAMTSQQNNNQERFQMSQSHQSDVNLISQDKMMSSKEQNSGKETNIPTIAGLLKPFPTKKQSKSNVNVNGLVNSVNSPKNQDTSRNLLDSAIQVEESKKFINSQLSMQKNDGQVKRCYSDVTHRNQTQNTRNANLFESNSEFSKRFRIMNKTSRAEGDNLKNQTIKDELNFQPTGLHITNNNRFSTTGLGSANFYSTQQELLPNKLKTKKFNSANAANMNKRDKAKQRWSKLNNVLRTISLLQRHRTKIINDPEDILTEINNFPTRSNTNRQKSSRPIHNDFEDKLRCEKFFKYISIGGQDGIQRIDKMINDDPKKHMHNIESNYHILNR